MKISNIIRLRRLNIGGLAFLGLLLLLSPNLQSATCPASACITVGADDNADVYVNNTFIGNVACSAHGPGLTCVNVPIALIVAGTNWINIHTNNTNAGYVWAGWDLDITNADGTHTHITSSDSGIDMYYQYVASSP